VDEAQVRTTIQEEVRRLEELIRRQASVFDGIVEAADLVATDDEHDPEGHTIAFERQQVAAVIRDAQQRLGELEGALRRIDAGDYGRCIDCGGPIGADRLEALPSTTRCVGCAARGSQVR
jgi:RNA polymerase-binding transcription factor DksA